MEGRDEKISSIYSGPGADRRKLRRRRLCVPEKETGQHLCEGCACQ